MLLHFGLEPWWSQTYVKESEPIDRVRGDNERTKRDEDDREGEM